MKKYYLAYGSNLSVTQMAHRCPNAVYVGTAEIPGYRLLFKGSKTGYYLTIEKKKGSAVPVLVWQISEWDERNLDAYEGYPAFYYKKEMKVELESFISSMPKHPIEALVYIMHEERHTGIPSGHYYETCMEGYQRFGFDKKILEQALKDSSEKEMLKGADYYV